LGGSRRAAFLCEKSKKNVKNKKGEEVITQTHVQPAHGSLGNYLRPYRLISNELTSTTPSWQEGRGGWGSAGTNKKENHFRVEVVSGHQKREETKGREKERDAAACRNTSTTRERVSGY